MAERKNSNSINITRIYDAPIKAVWQAWTDPEQTAQWWGPRGFTLTTHSKDLRPGGSWSYTMHGPDGVDYPNRAAYLEVEPYSKLVYDHGANAGRPPLFRVTALFSELHGKTKLDMTMSLATAEAADEMKKFIKKAGGDATWDRLAEYLEKQAAGKETFVINRTFAAPVEVLFEMWTNPKHFAKWLPPTGFEMQFIKADIKPGGRTFYAMNGNGVKMYGRAEYREIKAPDRLVYTQQFCDENEQVSRHPMSATWPETMLTQVIFAAEDAQATRVTVTWEPLGDLSTVELQTFVNARSGMTQGWSGSFDKLEAYLAESAGRW